MFYRLIALMFRHPLASRLRHEGKALATQLKTVLDEHGTEEVGQLRTGLAALIERLDKTSDEDWAFEYEQCFGHTAHSKVPAYELEYGEEHSHRQPQELADITAFYQAFGLQVSEHARERVDHVSAECEFMYFLMYKEAYALEHDGEEKAAVVREASRQFLADHLGSWLPAFTLRLAKYDPEGLMKQITDVTLAFVMFDCDRQGIEAGPRDLPIRAIQERDETGCVSCLESKSAPNDRGVNNGNTAV